jgi:hypothetical protein
MNRAGLCLNQWHLIDSHGKSLRIWASRNHYQELPIERSWGWDNFRRTIQEDRRLFLGAFHSRSSSPVVGMGASAKGNTFLQYYGLDGTMVDCVTDTNPNKIGKFTPGTGIPIRPDDALKEYKEVRVIPLAWNLNLENKIHEINPAATIFHR